MTKKEMPLSEFLQSEAYEVLRLAKQQELLNNNVMFNKQIKQHNKLVAIRTNLINHPQRFETLKHSTADRVELKRIKAELKSQAFNIVAKLKKEKEDLVQCLLSYSENMPNWSLKQVKIS